MSVRRGRPARFIVFEGIDGSGKSSALAAVADALAAEFPDLVTTREETDGPLGEAVRASIERRDDPLTTTFLFLADRAQHVQELRRMLGQGQRILCDRFHFSTYAYQAHTLQDRVADPLAWLEELHARFSIHPDKVLLFDVDPKEAVRRLTQRGAATPYEKVAFLEAVRANYLDLAQSYGEKFHVLDAGRSQDDVAAEATRVVRDWLTG
ncbi:MAG: dTMP kinase [Thermoplasmatota archaeon]